MQSPDITVNPDTLLTQLSELRTQELAPAENVDPVIFRRQMEAAAEHENDIKKEQEKIGAAKQAEAKLEAEMQKLSDPSAPAGLTQEQLAGINAGNPAPGMPEHPSEISRVTQMTIGELQQFALSLEAKISVLEQRFTNLVSENFKAKY